MGSESDHRPVASPIAVAPGPVPQPSVVPIPTLCTEAIQQQYKRVMTTNATTSFQLKQELFTSDSHQEESWNQGAPKASRVTLVGVGDVGVACAYHLLIRGFCSELILIDVLKDKLLGQVMDLQHGGAFYSTRVVAGESYADTANSDLCIITAGVRQREGEPRTELLSRNRALLEHIVPPLIQYSPQTILFLVSNPVDLLTMMAWKMSGLPRSRVLGSGTFLDSSRFRTLLGQALGVNPSSIDAMVLGEHGDTSFVYHSGIRVGGLPLHAHLDTALRSSQASVETYVDHVHQKVVAAANDVIRLKGYTNLAIGCAVAHIVDAILNDKRTIIPVSTCVADVDGLDSNIFLSLPCVLSRCGVEKKLQVRAYMSAPEWEKLCASTKALTQVAQSSGIDT